MAPVCQGRQPIYGTRVQSYLCSFPTTATWLRTTALGPTHEQPPNTSTPTPTRMTRHNQGIAARGCKSVPHHFPSQTLLHFSSRNPSTPGILKSPKSNHTIHHHPFHFYAHTTYKGHLFRSLLLHRVRLRDPLTGNGCQCRRARVPYGYHPAACAQSRTLRNRARPMK